MRLNSMFSQVLRSFMATMRRFAITPLLALSFTVVAGEAMAEPVPKNRITLERGIIAAGGSAGSDTAAYVVFVNEGPENAIVEAQCDCAETVELHLVDRSVPG